MTASTASTRTGVARKATMLLLGAMIACLGVFAISTQQAKAAPVSMDLEYGKLNLGFAFQGADILPAPAALPTLPTPTPLPDLWDARVAMSSPGINGGTMSSFKPAGCATPVTFGVYALKQNDAVDPVLDPPIVGATIIDPDTGQPIMRPFANSGQVSKGSVAINKIANPPNGDTVQWAVQTTPEANGSYPCGANPATATVEGDLVGTALTIDSVPDLGPSNNHGLASGFRFPIMVVPNPLDSSPVPVTIAATGNLTGTYDAGTGALTLDGPIEARVLTGLASNPLGTYCALPLAGLTLSTTSNDDFPGVPFTAGFDGAGAMTGTYNIVDNATAVGGADCATVNSVSKGLGSLWVSSDIATPPTCPENTTGIPPNCDPIPCGPGFLPGNEPNCVRAFARISKVTFTGPGSARKGQTKTYVIRVTNNGNIAATGVRLVTTGRGIRVNSPIRVINPGVTRTVRLRVRFRYTGRVVARASVRSSNAGSRGAQKVIIVRR